MARPKVGNFAEAIYSQVTPMAWDDDTQGWALLLFCGALGAIFQQNDTLARADGRFPPWSMLVDINRIPDEGLAWFGQFVGVVVDTSLPAADQRQQIRDHLLWDRGTIAALRKVCAQYLTGNKTVQIRERDTSPYHITVITFAGETTISTMTYADYYALASYEDIYFGYDSYLVIWMSGSGLNNDIYYGLLHEKAAGLVLSYRIHSAWDYWDLWEENLSYQPIYDNFSTYLAVYNGTATGVPALYHQVINYLSYDEIWNADERYSEVYDRNLTY